MSAGNQKNTPYLQSHRIAIIGNCGSGKTALSKQLNTFFELPVYHLDDLFWETDWTPTESTVWKHKMDTLVSKDKWIIDGTFEDTLSLRLARADLVIFLDIPLWRCLWRVIVRDIKRYSGQRKTLPLKIRNQPHPPKGGEGRIRFWLYVTFFPFRRRKKIINQLKNIMCEKVILCGNREIEQWLNTLKKS